MTRYLMDTNIASYCIRQQPIVLANLVSAPASSLHISVITEAALLFGLAAEATLITHNQAFRQITALTVADWTRY